eukprot:scaffold3618_cov129-Cylindrotheca_fusiformis.AAC.13
MIRMEKIAFVSVSILLAFSYANGGAATAAAAPEPDRHDNCEYWANSGECEKNSGYMLANCATSCDLVAAQAVKDAKELAKINSFFELSAKDIHGDIIEFSKFEGDVTIIVNVASYCGYTDSHYKGMVRLWKQLSVSDQVHLLAFPCNQFGGQEPESNEAIEEFVNGYGVEFTMMDKIDVNGPNASIVYKYLKSKTNIGNISWNFATYFIVATDGTVTAHSGVEPMDIRDVALGLVDGQEL